MAFAVTGSKTCLRESRQDSARVPIALVGYEARPDLMRRLHKQISITLEPEIFDALEVAKETTRLSRSTIIEAALAKHLAITLAALQR